MDPSFSTAYGSATGAPFEVVYTAPSLLLNTCWDGMLDYFGFRSDEAGRYRSESASPTHVEEAWSYICGEGEGLLSLKVTNIGWCMQ